MASTHTEKPGTAIRRRHLGNATRPRAGRLKIRPHLDHHAGLVMPPGETDGRLQLAGIGEREWNHPAIARHE